MSKSIVGNSGRFERVNVGTFTCSLTTSNEIEVYLIDATCGNITVNLQSSIISEQYPIVIKKIDSSANTVTIDGYLSETIDGGLTVVLSTQYDSITIISDNSNWFIIKGV